VGIFRKYALSVATISRLLKMIGLFCKRALWKRLYSVKETCNFKEPSNRSHPISVAKKRENCHVRVLHWNTLIWVESIKLYVSFAKEPYKRDGILQKRIYLSRKSSHIRVLHWIVVLDYYVKSFYDNIWALSQKCTACRERATNYHMRRLLLVGTENNRSLLQKSPIKEMIFCKRDL